MRNLMRAFFYKLFKDWTFRITLFIGLGLAVIMTLIYLAIDRGFGSSELGEGVFCTGQNLLMTSISPAQNFGIAIPVNLVSFTVMEFNHGTIRNKIIAGNSKGKIYLSLLLSGLTFTFLLMLAYVGLCTGLASIFGGFDINGPAMSSILGAGNLTPDYFWKTIVLALLAYALITCIAVFFATLFRNIGPCIPIVILLILVAYFSAAIIGSMSSLPGMEQTAQVLRFVNPLYALAAPNVVSEKLTITNQEFFIELGNTLVYATIFVAAGFIIFKKRDVK